MEKQHAPQRRPRVLIDEEPLVLLPSLAVAIGVYEAIVLQQMHYWMHPSRNSGKVVDGRRWIYNTYPQWQEQFPFWTTKVIGNTIRSLEARGLIDSRQDLNPAGVDRAKWYSVNYAAVADIEAEIEADQHPDPDPQCPNRDAHGPNRDHECPNRDHLLYTETTPETTTENPPTPRGGGSEPPASPPVLLSFPDPDPANRLTPQPPAVSQLGYNGKDASPEGRGGKESGFDVAEAFAEFWAVYPRKVGKPQAEKAYRKKVRSEAEALDVLRGLERWVGSEEWNREKRFIPHPTTWLNREGWNDVPLTPEKHAGRGFSMDDLDRLEQLAREQEGI